MVPCVRRCDDRRGLAVRWWASRAFAKSPSALPAVGMMFLTGCALMNRQPAPVADAELTNGLDYSYYEGDWEHVPDFSKLSPVRSGAVETFDLSPGRRADRFGMTFSGYLEAPKDGLYTIYAGSDDGCRLFVDGTELVNNDGVHTYRERAGQISLKAGKHPIAVRYFEREGPEKLQVSYSGPGVPKQPIPRAALWHVAPPEEGASGEKPKS